MYKDEGTYSYENALKYKIFCAIVPTTTSLHTRSLRFAIFWEILENCTNATKLEN